MFSVFVKKFKRINKRLECHNFSKTADLHDVVYTIFAKDITVTVNYLYSFVRTFIPDAETQVKFDDSIEIFLFHHLLLGLMIKKTNTGLDFQVDIDSAHNI